MQRWQFEPAGHDNHNWQFAGKRLGRGIGRESGVGQRH
jgi:hypothetical protein